MPPTNIDTRFDEIMQLCGLSSDSYLQSHATRYRETTRAIERFRLHPGSIGLEIGTTWVFAITLRSLFDFQRVDVTIFDPKLSGAVRNVTCPYPAFSETFKSFSVNLENEPIPVEDDTYDFVLCAEVIEHLDVDPMFMLVEINRVMKPGGRLLLTTPNCTSSQNVWKILNGYAPHFYMQYHRDRSPYRHNIEYAPNQIRSLLDGAGFDFIDLWTPNTFEPAIPAAFETLRRNGFSVDLRGDNIFAAAVRGSAPRERFPPTVYV